MCARSPFLPFPRHALRSGFQILPFPHGALMPERSILSFPQAADILGQLACPFRSARTPPENSPGFYLGAESSSFFSILPFARGEDALGKFGPPFPRDLSVFFLQNAPHPRDFEDLFFLVRERDEEPRAALLLEEAAALEERAAKLKLKAQVLLDEEIEKEKARAEAKLKEKLEAIAAAEKEAAELLAKAAAMKAELPMP